MKPISIASNNPAKRMFDRIDRMIALITEVKKMVEDWHPEKEPQAEDKYKPPHQTASV